MSTIDPLLVVGAGLTSQRARDRLINALRDKGIHNEVVLEAMRRIPRHLFIEEALDTFAYQDNALPIGWNQTISQPYTVAMMTDLLLNNKPSLNRVLEIGTGSGYQTVLLSKFISEIYTVERIKHFYLKAKDMFGKLGVSNVVCFHGDGYKGHEAAAPYDGILVTAAASTIPQALLSQLAEGGRLVIPAEEGEKQTLRVFERLSGKITERVICSVNFVPLVKGVC